MEWTLSSGIKRPGCERDLNTVPRLTIHGDMTPLMACCLRSIGLILPYCSNKWVQSLGPPTKTTCFNITTWILLKSGSCHTALVAMTIRERESRASLITDRIKSRMTKEYSALFPTWHASLHSSRSIVTLRMFPVFHAVSGCYLQLTTYLLSKR